MVKEHHPYSSENLHGKHNYYYFNEKYGTFRISVIMYSSRGIIELTNI